MQVKQAMDEFLFYMEVERNVYVNTIRSYAYDLHVFEAFLTRVQGKLDIERFYGGHSCAENRQKSTGLYEVNRITDAISVFRE
nr:site-specific integrase [Brevibacillus sp. MER 51]